MLEVIKRNGIKVEFESNKIKIAIEKAMKNGSGIYKPDIAKRIADEIETIAKTKHKPMTIYQIEDLVFTKLVEYGEELTAKAYEGYRAVQEFKRIENTTDDSILGLVRGYNDEVMKENSNKNPTLASTQRDLIAGEISKDIARRKLLPAKIVQGHENGAIHIHDMDYLIQPIFNCCLVNIKDMFENGTVINGKLIESPKSFQVACTVLTQIIASVSSGQFGGQSINVKHLGKYLRRSHDKFYEQSLHRLLKRFPFEEAEILAEEEAEDRTKQELKQGIQTLQYQINTLLTSNGQSPFVTLFLEIEEGHEYEKEIAMIVEEILKQRYIGLKNENGVYVTPTFPKLIYLLDENNVTPDSKYWNITKLSVQTSAKRMYPDYISAKKMRENHEGQVFSPMGCRSFLTDWKDENGNYKYEGRFNQAVVSLNLPQIAILSKGNEEEFWKILEERLELCREALEIRHNLLLGTPSDISPIHWQNGAIARLDKGEKIDKYLKNGYSTLSLGYIGVYETVKLLTGKSHTTKEGKDLAIRILKKLKNSTDNWQKQTGLGFSIYGTPAESLCYRFAELDRKNFGEIEDVTDKGFYINSYHVDIREEIDAFSKLSFENEFQSISSGGCISYIEVPNMSKNLEALESIIKFIYDNIQYAEINTKSDYCYVCDYEGEILLNDDCEWYCPQCGNKDESRLSVVRRTCGYLGANFWNEGKTKEIKSRVLHI